MSLKFMNIRSGEKLTAETEPMITALWASSDRSPNITQGQDFGWRLAPEVVVKMEAIARNPRMIERIATTYAIPVDSITESDILHFISDQNSPETQGDVETDQFKDEYERELAELRKPKPRKTATPDAE